MVEQLSNSTASMPDSWTSGTSRLSRTNNGSAYPEHQGAYLARSFDAPSGTGPADSPRLGAVSEASGGSGLGDSGSEASKHGGEIFAADMVAARVLDIEGRDNVKGIDNEYNAAVDAGRREDPGAPPEPSTAPTQRHAATGALGRPAAAAATEAAARLSSSQARRETRQNADIFSAAAAFNLYRTYERVQVLGRGQFSVAMLLRCPHTGKRVVSKQVSLQDIEAADLNIKMIENEVHLLRSLSHPHIVTYLAAYQHAGALCVILEYAGGGTLASALRERTIAGRDFPPAEVRRWISQSGQALQYMHERAVLHRDLSTKNIFLSEGGDAVVGDLGLSKALDRSQGGALASTMCGTPYYLSPEMLGGQPYGKPADVWALGVVMYELLTLQRPFAAANIFALQKKVTACDYDETALECCPHPPELRWLASREALLHPQPTARLSLAAMQAKLEALDSSLASSTPQAIRQTSDVAAAPADSGASYSASW